MRSKVKVGGKFYHVVPWLVAGGCNGCAFIHEDTTTEGCLNHRNDAPCDDGGELDGHILIPSGKEARAAYVARLLDPPQK